MCGYSVTHLFSYSFYSVILLFCFYHLLLPLTIYYSLFTINYSLFAIYYLLFTINHLPFTIYHSPFTIFKKDKRMKFLALEKEIPDVDNNRFTQELLRMEAVQAWKLTQQAIFREIYFRSDSHEAVIILECDSLEFAHDALNSLPLMQAGLIAFDIAPLVPYRRFCTVICFSGLMRYSDEWTDPNFLFDIMFAVSSFFIT